LAGVGTATAGAPRARRAPRQRGGGLAATLVEPPERCRATRRHHYGAERRVAAPRHGHLRERPPSGRSLRHGTACCAKPSATPGVKPTAAAHQRRRLQRAQTSKKKRRVMLKYPSHMLHIGIFRKMWAIAGLDVGKYSMEEIGF